MSSTDWRNPNWDPQAAIDSLVQEQNLLGRSPTEQAGQILREAAPYAAQSVVNIALYGDNERTRLAAAQYVLDRNLGRTGEEKQQGTDVDPITALLAEVVTDIEAIGR